MTQPKHIKARKDAILAELQDNPSTVYTLAEKLPGSPQVIYRTLMELVQDEYVAVQPWRDGRKDVYALTTKSNVAGGLSIHTPEGARDIEGVLAFLTERANPHPVASIALGLQYLYRRDYTGLTDRMPEGYEGSTHIIVPGSLTKQQVKEVYRQILRELDQIIKVTQQLLLARELWDEKNENLDKYGIVPNPAKRLEMAGRFDEQVYPLIQPRLKQV